MTEEGLKGRKVKEVLGTQHSPKTACLLCLHSAVSNGPVESVTLENSPLVWKEGRQLLRQ